MITDRYNAQNLKPSLKNVLCDIHMTPLLTGGRLNKKDGLTRYGDSHVKDKAS